MGGDAHWTVYFTLNKQMHEIHRHMSAFKQTRSKLMLTDCSTIGIRDCNTLATLNLIFGTLEHASIRPVSLKLPNKMVKHK